MSDDNLPGKNQNVEQDDHRTAAPAELDPDEAIGLSKLFRELRRPGEWMTLLGAFGRAAVGAPVFAIAAAGLVYSFDKLLNLGNDSNVATAFMVLCLVLSVGITSVFYRFAFKMPWGDARNYAIGAGIVAFAVFFFFWR